LVILLYNVIIVIIMSASTADTADRLISYTLTPPSVGSEFSFMDQLIVDSNSCHRHYGWHCFSSSCSNLNH
jgi:hypothetical protein